MAGVLLVASAAAADPFPQLVVDRPLVYAPGMTAVDIGIDAPTYRFGLSSNTRLGDYVYADLVISHASGPLQLGLRFVDNWAGPLVTASARGYVGPGALAASITFRIPNNESGLDSEYQQYVGYAVKSTVVPHVLSLDAGGGLYADEYRPMYSQQVTPVVGGLSGGGILQVVPELSLGVAGGVFVPLLETDQAHTSLFASATATYVIDRFDVYAWGRIDDVQRSPLPSVGGGVITRFGN